MNWARVILFNLFITAAASAGVLYDGALGTSPVDQGLPYASLPATPFFVTAGNLTTLDTSADNTIYAGFGTTSTEPLDRAAGYTVRFDIRIASSDFVSTSRAGFSVIALSSDARGIEIGFHSNAIFAQGDSPLFVRAEEAAFDTTAALTRYDLEVLGNSYTLRAEGIARLTGTLRDYSAFIGLLDPYETPNFLFFGDDTTSARGKTEIGYIATIAPEPTSLAMLSGVALFTRRRH